MGCALELQMELQSLDFGVRLRLFPLQSPVASVGNRDRFSEFPLELSYDFSIIV
jgi:hypothetical protein